MRKAKDGVPMSLSPKAIPANSPFRFPLELSRTLSRAGGMLGQLGSKLRVLSH